jgi:hypothetical protein
MKVQMGNILYDDGMPEPTKPKKRLRLYPQVEAPVECPHCSGGDKKVILKGRRVGRGFYKYCPACDFTWRPSDEIRRLKKETR